MTDSQNKNLGFSIFNGMIILYVLLFNFSWIGAAGAVLGIGGIFLASMAFDKQEGILSKLDLYILFTVLALIAIKYNDLIGTLDWHIIRSSSTGRMVARWFVLIVGEVLGLVLNSGAKRQNSYAAQTVMKYAGLFLIAFCASFFIFGDFTGLTQYFVIFVFLGFISFWKLHLSPGSTGGRGAFIAELLAVLVILVKALCPGFSLSNMDSKAFFSLSVFPWYNVCGITLICLTIGGVYLRFSKKPNAFYDEDMLLLSGLIGFVWIFKASLYYYFDFSWVALVIYSGFFIGYINRFIRRKLTGKRPAKKDALYKPWENESYLLLITAIAIVAVIYLTNLGYILFWLGVLLTVLGAYFIHRNFGGWVRDAVFWQTLLICIAGSASLFTLQNGYSEEKLIVVAVLFAFTSVVMWMLNHRNEIGQNQFKKTKVFISVVFGILVLTATVKSGSHIDVHYTNAKADGGSLFKEDTTITVQASADGKDNAVKELKYIWADSFFYKADEAAIIAGTEAELKIENHHLILWTTDTNGIVRKKDCWFYDKTPDDMPVSVSKAEDAETDGGR